MEYAGVCVLLLPGYVLLSKNLLLLFICVWCRSVCCCKRTRVLCPVCADYVLKVARKCNFVYPAITVITVAASGAINKCKRKHLLNNMKWRSEGKRKQKTENVTQILMAEDDYSYQLKDLVPFNNTNNPPILRWLLCVSVINTERSQIFPFYSYTVYFHFTFSFSIP